MENPLSVAQSADAVKISPPPQQAANLFDAAYNDVAGQSRSVVVIKIEDIPQIDYPFEPPRLYMPAVGGVWPTRPPITPAPDSAPTAAIPKDLDSGPV